MNTNPITASLETPSLLRIEIPSLSETVLNVEHTSMVWLEFGPTVRLTIVVPSVTEKSTTKFSGVVTKRRCTGVRELLHI